MVPDSFEAFEGAIKATYDRLVAEGTLVPQPDVPPPSVPMDLEAAKKAGKVTAHALFLQTSCEHGHEAKIRLPLQIPWCLAQAALAHG